MSQQHMNPNERRLDEPHASYGEYNGLPTYDTYSNASFGQKHPLKSNPASLSSGHRLALAIVSLVLWVIVCVFVGISMLHVPVYVEANFGAITINNPYMNIMYGVLISSLLIFTVLVLAINILFNRRR